MFTLTLLGPARLDGPLGELGGRVVQRRQVALLSILALSPGRRATRDKLLASFWPDAPTERARHNLADALYVVRKVLGESAILTPGDDVVLNDQVVATDVDAHASALDRGDDAGAVALYRGPLLDGFHLPDAPEFEHQVDVERTRLASAHAAALERLARARAMENLYAESVALWRQLVATEPLNSRLTVELMRALASAGDRAAAVRHAQVHAALLKAELDCRPDDDVTELAAALQHSAGPTDTAQPPAGIRSPATLRPSARRSRARGAPVLLSGALAIALFGAGALGIRSRGVDVVADRIGVLPFEVLPGTADGDVGRLTAHAVTNRLVQAEIGDVVLPHETAIAAGDRAGAERAMRAFGAGLVVRGTVHQVGDTLILSSVVMESPDMRSIAAVGPLRVPAHDLPRAADSLAERVVGALAAHLSRTVAAHPYVIQSATLESFRTADYGNSLFVRRDFTAAALEFQRAYQLDTTAVGFLLWSAISYLNTDSGERTDAILAQLAPRRRQLVGFDAAQYDWLAAVRRGDRAGALAEARKAHAVAPHSGLGGYQLGRELLHHGRAHEALHVLQGLDPSRGWLSGWNRYWIRLASAHHMLGEHEREARVAAMVPDGHSEVKPWIEVHALAAACNVPALMEVLAAERRPDLAYEAAKELLTHGADSAAVARVALLGLNLLRAQPEPGQSAAMARRRGAEAQFLIHAGQLDEARMLLEGVVSVLPTNQLFITWLGIVAARLGDRDRAQELLARLEEFGRERETGIHLARRAAIRAQLGPDRPNDVLALLERSFRAGMRLNDLHNETPFLEMRGRHPSVERFFGARD